MNTPVITSIAPFIELRMCLVFLHVTLLRDRMIYTLMNKVAVLSKVSKITLTKFGVVI